ncbi:LysE family translocator [Insolitispirillum peregrinum]|uniref:LysE family translocator n=1 Tax=Insolitispirillum peregrinum TaxID=80876 RepID=UPI003616C001
MDLHFGTLGLYVLSVITMIAIPGPVAILTTGAGLAGGPWQALRTIFGTNIASLVLILASALVIKGLFAINETAFSLLKLAGACYIGMTGWSILRSARTENGMVFAPRVGGFAKGFVMAISNPKDIIFFASFFPQFLGVTPNTNHSLAILTGAWVLLDFATLMLIYLVISKALKPSAHQTMLRLSGILLLLIAAGGMTFSSLDLSRLLIP